MMITKILIINDLGVFDDFNWNRDSTLQDFKEKNIIYGWNYSGKTMFSRIFSSLRDKSLHTDFTSANFKLKTDDGYEFDSTDICQNPFKVKVFNKEYIESKLTWDSNTKLGEPIAFDVGENVATRNEIIRLQEKIDKANERKKNHQLKIDIFYEFEKWRFTKESKSIRLIISNNTISFDKGHFKSILLALSKDSLEKNIIIEPNKIEDLKIISNSTDDFSDIPKITFNIQYENLKKAAKELLVEEPTKDIVIDILENNIDLYQWVKQGLDFDENKEICSFCGNSITEERITNLNNYYSNASKDLRDRIKALKARIYSEKQSITNLEIPKSKNDFTEKVRTEIEHNLSSFQSVQKNYSDNLQELICELERKEDGNIFNSLKIKNIPYNQNEIQIWIDSSNKSIGIHNSLISNFETERNTARDTLKKHLIADFLKIETYFEKKEISDKANAWMNAYDQYIIKTEKLKTEKQDSLKTITKGKDELNKFIQKFLSRDDIEISVTEEDKFLLLRKQRPAKNLSEGEKTAIAFSYFLVEFESLGIEDMRKTIVFIDDPISSLDTNHIAQVYSLINSYFFRNKIELDKPEKVINCFKQFFISTHNFEFFSFLRDSYNLTKRKRIPNLTTGEKTDIPNCGYYLIQNVDSEKSIIKELPKTLKKI